MSETNTSRSITIADMDRDGALDLISVGLDDSFTGRLTIQRGNGDGTFRAGTSYSTEANGSRDVATGDLNGDGWLDLVSTGYDSAGAGFVTVRLASGGGSFGAATSYSVSSSEAREPRQKHLILGRNG